MTDAEHQLAHLQQQHAAAQRTLEQARRIQRAALREQAEGLGAPELLAANVINAEMSVLSADLALTNLALQIVEQIDLVAAQTATPSSP